MSQSENRMQIRRCGFESRQLSTGHGSLGKPILSLVTGQKHLKEKSWICGILDLERGRKMNQSIPSFYKLEGCVQGK